MAKGVIYVMSTAVSGLIKIGKTETKNFDSNMERFERNGYHNVGGLKRAFAIEVDAYEEKEKLLTALLRNHRIANSSLYANDLDQVIQLLSAFEGKQIYPAGRRKKTVSKEITRDPKEKRDTSLIPNGEYYLKAKVRGFGDVDGTMRVEDGVITVLQGSRCAPMGKSGVSALREEAKIDNHILQEDIVCSSPSAAGGIILGHSNNGWAVWKTKDNQPIERYRQEKNRKEQK